MLAGARRNAHAQQDISTCLGYHSGIPTTVGQVIGPILKANAPGILSVLTAPHECRSPVTMMKWGAFASRWGERRHSCRPVRVAAHGQYGNTPTRMSALRRIPNNSRMRPLGG